MGWRIQLECDWPGCVETVRDCDATVVRNAAKNAGWVKADQRRWYCKSHAPVRPG